MSDQEVLIIEESPLSKDYEGESEGRPSEFTCETCGKPLIYGGRGRYPRFCDEHKASRGSSPVSKRTSGSKGIAAIRTGMEQIYDLAGDGAIILGRFTQDEALTLDGGLIKQRSAVLAEQWAELAERDPKVREALSRMTTGSSWGGVIITHVMLIGAMMVNHKNHSTKEPRVKKERPPRDNVQTNGRQPQPQPTPRPQPQPTSPVATEPEPEEEVYLPGINAPDALFPTDPDAFAVQ